MINFRCIFRAPFFFPCLKHKNFFLQKFSFGNWTLKRHTEKKISSSSQFSVGNWKTRFLDWKSGAKKKKSRRRFSSTRERRRKKEVYSRNSLENEIDLTHSLTFTYIHSQSATHSHACGSNTCEWGKLLSMYTYVYIHSWNKLMSFTRFQSWYDIQRTPLNRDACSSKKSLVAIARKGYVLFPDPA